MNLKALEITTVKVRREDAELLRFCPTQSVVCLG